MIIIMLLITLPHHSMCIHRQWWPPTAVGCWTLESGLVVFVVSLCFLSILKYFLKFVAILRHVAFAFFTLATVSPSPSSRVRADRAHHNHSGLRCRPRCANYKRVCTDEVLHFLRLRMRLTLCWLADLMCSYSSSFNISY